SDSSDLVTALLVMLGARATIAGFNSPTPPPTPHAAPGGCPGAPAPAGQSSSLGGLFGDGGGGLGGPLAGAAAPVGLGGAKGLSGGLDELLRRFEENGQGSVVSSWIGSGPNASITAEQLSQGLGSDLISELAARTGLPPDQIAGELARELPIAVDKM